MKKVCLALLTAAALSFLGSTAIAQTTINYDDAETGITSGTPDLDNESTGNSSTVTGNFTDNNGNPGSYTATAMVVSGITSYGVTNGGPNNSDENRVEYQASSDRFTFSSGWDSGDGATGEYVTQMLTVTFDRVSDAADFSVSLTSANTAGEAFESTAVQFIDGAGNLVGLVGYNGFWDASDVGGTVNTDVVSNTADVWTAEDTSVIDALTDSNNPTGTSNGPLDNATIFASDFVTGGVTGYKITRFLEDVATVGGVAGTGTTTTTNFTTSNNAATISAVPEPSALALAVLGIIGLVAQRRRQ